MGAEEPHIFKSLAFTCVYGHDWETAEALQLSDVRHCVPSRRLSVLWVTGA